MRKKILSLALACLMIMTAFATMVSAETTAPFTVTGNDEGETSVDCPSWTKALEKVYEYGGGTINMNTDYGDKSTAKAPEANPKTSNERVTIVVNGNNHKFEWKGTGTSSSATARNSAILNFNYNDDVTFNNVVFYANYVRLANVNRGTTLTFKNCNFDGDNCKEQYGYILMTDDFAGDNVTTTVKIEGGTYNFRSGGSGISAGSKYENLLDVELKNCTLTSTGGLTYRAANVTAENIKFNYNYSNAIQRVFRSHKSGTIKLLGSETYIKENNKSIFDVSETNQTSSVNVYIDKGVELQGASLVALNGNGSSLNIYTQEASFFTKTTDSSVVTYTAPTMIGGASIRIDEQNSGLRFSATFDKEATGAQSYGMILTKAANLTGGVEFTHALGNKCVDQPATNGIDGTRYNVAICGIEADNYATKYAARAYATYLYSGNANVTVTVYSDFDATDSTAEGKGNVRSIQDVADAALNDTKTEITETGDGFFYEHKIADGVYSRYTKEQYEAIKTYASSN